MQDGVQLPGLLVTGNYFQVLGARPVMGRALLPSDAVAPGGNAVAVLSEYAWRSRFGADPAIVGKRVPLGRQSFEVVGVIRRGMVLPGQQSIGFWAPLTMARAFEVANPWTDSNASLSVVGRLRDGVTVRRHEPGSMSGFGSDSRLDPGPSWSRWWSTLTRDPGSFR